MAAEDRAGDAEDRDDEQREAANGAHVETHRLSAGAPERRAVGAEHRRCSPRRASRAIGAAAAKSDAPRARFMRATVRRRSRLVVGLRVVIPGAYARRQGGIASPRRATADLALRGDDSARSRA